MTREEAIETVRICCPRISVSECDFETAMRVLVPELREIEDEKIRKEIVGFLRKFEKQCCVDNCYKHWITWLEKQKEQKPTEIDEYEIIKKHITGDSLSSEVNKRLTECGWYVTEQNPVEWSEKDERVMKAIEGAIKAYGKTQGRYLAGYDMNTLITYLKNAFISLENQKTLFHSGFGLYYYSDGKAIYVGNPAESNLYDFAISHQEKQKEQKPVDLTTRFHFITPYGFIKPTEWSDTDNIGWDEALACVTRAEKAAKNEEELQNAVTAEKWLKEIKFKYYVHPVKQEWSKEDEEALKRAIDCVRTWEIDYCDGDNKISERLKSFNGRFYLQPKNEWRHYIWAVNLRFNYDALVRYEDNGAYEIVTAGNKPKRQVSGDYFLLKDTAYKESSKNWKPSEEQMKALDSAINYLTEHTCTPGNPLLISLYHDIKNYFNL